MSSLTEDVITSILARLPVKSLLRFRCVSKPWCSRIDSPYFIKLHLTHSIANPSNYFPVIKSFFKKTLNSLDTDSLENLEIVETPLKDIPEKTLLYNTCNGLLLLETTRNDLILFNPSTRKHIVLPTPPLGNKYDHLGSVHDPPPHCLGYDVVNDDYKVFVFCTVFDKVTNKFISCEAKIYSLKSNSWKIVEDFTKRMPCYCVFEAYVNGALYSVHNEDQGNIVALDVGKERFYKIPMPNFEDKNVSLFHARDFFGCLAVSCMYPGHRTDIWVMKEFEVKESWSMLLSVKPEISRECVTPMVYIKSRKVLLCYDHQDLVLYDLRKKTITALDDTHCPIRYCEVYVESLVSFGGTQIIDEKKKQHGEEK